jgi:hypothetical protein
MPSTVYIVWDRVAKSAVPGTFASSADATAHIARLATKDTRSLKTPTRDAVAVTV